MITDRPAVSPRSTPVADRPTAGAGRPQAPSSDTFSALLGAATPKGDTPARRDDASTQRDAAAERRDERPRSDRAHRGDRRPAQRHDAAHAASAQPAEAQAPVPVADPAVVAAAVVIPPEATPAPAVADAAQDAAAGERPAAPATPNLFTLQLASPLAPQPASTGAVAAAAATEAALPAFAGQVPASVVAATAAQATVAGEVPVPAADPAGAIALPGLPAEATADLALPAGLDLAGPRLQTPSDAAATGAPQDAQVASPLPQQGAADGRPQGQPNPPAPAAAAAETGPADAPAPAQVAPPSVTASPIALPVVPLSMPRAERAVPLSRAIATTGVMVHMMSDKGVNHARLNLKPAELGGIEVRLRSSDQGIHALLVADSPEAARMLASAGDDLKRQLESKNVTLLTLDVSTSDKRQEQPAGFSADGFGDGDPRPGQSRNAGASGAQETTLLMQAPGDADTTLVLPDGVHVDVLA